MLVVAALSPARYQATAHTGKTVTVASISPIGRYRLHRRDLAKPVAAVRELTYTVTATAYQAVAAQTDDDPFTTADNSRIKPHYSSKTRWLAISQDLLTQGGGKFQYGDKVLVRGISPQLDGIYTVHDTMNKRHRHCVDILTHPREKIDLFTKDVQLKLVPIALTRQPVRSKASARLRATAQRASPARKQWLAPSRHTDYFASAIL